MQFAFEIEREFDKILGIEEAQKRGKSKGQRNLKQIDPGQCLLNQVHAAQLSEQLVDQTLQTRVFSTMTVDELALQLN